jgi:hypothetical protein
MTIKRQEQFVWGHDEDRGMSGWVLASMPHFDPVQGFALAHDMLEHTDTYPGMEGEAMAFGGICYIRIEGGYMDEERSSRGARPDRHEYAITLGYELANFFEHENDDHGGWVIERTEEPPVDDEELELLFADIARETSRQGQKEFLWSEDEEERREHRRDMRKAAVSIIPWLRRGYRKCEAFWEAGNPQQMSCLFRDIESTIDTEIDHTEHYPGDRISVHINEDLTWGWETIEGRDANGDLWENGELVDESADKEEDEDE